MSILFVTITTASALDVQREIVTKCVILCDVNVFSFRMQNVSRVGIGCAKLVRTTIPRAYVLVHVSILLCILLQPVALVR